MDPRTFIEEVLPERAEQALERLAGRTSVGCVVFRVLDVGVWSLRIDDGRLGVSPYVEDDALLQLTVSAADFEPLIVRSLERAAGSDKSMTAGALRALSLDARTARGLRHMPGSVALVIQEDEIERRLLLSPGVGEPRLDAPDCTVTCSMDDYVAMQTGAAQPMQLFADGRVRLAGNVQLALALSGIFA